jgi:GNAT superfamily N-acetyltransferase
MDVRNPRQEEMREVFGLINNTFRKDLDPTMEIEFPLLFSDQNLPHIFIAKDSGQIVSHVAAYVTDLLIPGLKIRTGFLGAVATHPDFREKGHASKVLEALEDQLIRESVEMILISGNRNLYLRRGFREMGKSMFFEIAGEEEEGLIPVEIEPLTPDLFQEVCHLYWAEDVRFRRTETDFSTLLQVHEQLLQEGPKSLEKAQIGPTYLVKAFGIYRGYFTFKADQSRIIEYAGSRISLLSGMEKLVRDGHPSFQLIIPESDLEFLNMLIFNHYSSTTSTYFPPNHTVKIVNSESLYERLGIMEDTRLTQFALPPMPLPGFNFV